MSTMNYKSNLILIGLSIIISCGVFLYRSLSRELEIKTLSSTQRSPFVGSDQFISGEYTNGTYTATGKYISPGGQEEIELTLILEGDVVIDANLIKKAELPTSIFFQGKFESSYKEFVVGKNINEIKIDKVSGSSLTSGGFNEALKRIKSQAKL